MISIHLSSRGFIALVSVTIIAIVLLLTATVLSFSGFYGRYNILDSELKKKSSALADACVEEARIRLINDATYSGDATSTINMDECYISSVDTTSIPGQASFRVRSMYKKYYTIYAIRLKTADASILSFEERTKW